MVYHRNKTAWLSLSAPANFGLIEDISGGGSGALLLSHSRESNLTVGVLSYLAKNLHSSTSFLRKLKPVSSSFFFPGIYCDCRRLSFVGAMKASS